MKTLDLAVIVPDFLFIGFNQPITSNGKMIDDQLDFIITDGGDFLSFNLGDDGDVENAIVTMDGRFMVTSDGKFLVKNS